MPAFFVYMVRGYKQFTFSFDDYSSARALFDSARKSRKLGRVVMLRNTPILVGSAQRNLFIDLEANALETAIEAAQNYANATMAGV